MNYATIKKTDVANGPGVRVSLFVSGCTHHCKGCFNSEAWDLHRGNRARDSAGTGPGLYPGLELTGRGTHGA